MFGKTYIIENIDVSKNIENTRLVTLDGDLVESSGAITGGYYTRKKFSVSFNIEEDNISLIDLEKKLSEYDSKKQSLKAEIEKIEDTLKSLDIKKAESSTGITTINKEKIELSKERDSLVKDRSILDKSIEEVSNNLEKQKNLHSNTKLKIDPILKEISNLEKKRQMLRKV